MKIRAFLRYLVLQIPEALVLGVLLFWARSYFDWALWVPVALLIARLLKDLAMYPFVRRVFEEELPDRVGAGRLIGEDGVAAEEISSSGYVRVNGELWRAEIVDAPLRIAAGSPVRVHEVRGLTLLVTVVVESDG